MGIQRVRGEVDCFFAGWGCLESLTRPALGFAGYWWEAWCDRQFMFKDNELSCCVIAARWSFMVSLMSHPLWAINFTLLYLLCFPYEWFIYNLQILYSCLGSHFEHCLSTAGKLQAVQACGMYFKVKLSRHLLQKSVQLCLGDEFLYGWPGIDNLSVKFLHCSFICQ